MKKVINVTKNDIKNGTCNDPERCAVAMAANRVFKSVGCIASVGTQDIHGQKIGTFDFVFKVDLPEIARKFIDRYDSITVDSKKMKPFKFTLDIPDVPCVV